jgi:nitroreductase
MKLDAVVKNRRSIKKYKPGKVPKKVLKKAFEAARWAPSVHNIQPWNFVVVEGRMKKKLAEIAGRYPKGEVLLVRLILKESIKIMEQAPTVILVYKKNIFLERIKRGGKRFYDLVRLWEAQSVASAVQNMLLTFHSMGAGATWLGLPLLCAKKINKFFGIKGELMAILAVGYPAEIPPAPTRKPLSEIVSFKSTPAAP